MTPGRTVTVRIKRDSDLRKDGSDAYAYAYANCYNSGTSVCNWKGYAHEDYDLVVKYGTAHTCGRSSARN